MSLPAVDIPEVRLDAATADATTATTFRRMTERGLFRVAAPGPRDIVITAELRDRMAELTALAEGHGERATLADFRDAVAIAAALGLAEGIVLCGWRIDADMLQARLARFKDAADRSTGCGGWDERGRGSGKAGGNPRVNHDRLRLLAVIAGAAVLLALHLVAGGGHAWLPR